MTSSTEIGGVLASVEAMAEKRKQEEDAVPRQQTLEAKLAEEQRKAREVEKALEEAGVGRRYIRESLASYLPRDEKQRAALAWAREYCESRKAAEGDGVLFAGKPGAGKTHLLCAILREYAAGGATICYVTVEDFFLALQSTFGAKGHTEEDVLRRYAAPTVLVLDDLQSVRNGGGDAWQYRRLWTLLDRRYRDLRATLTSTNLDLKEFTDMIDQRTRRRLEATVIHF